VFDFVADAVRDALEHVGREAEPVRYVGRDGARACTRMIGERRSKAVSRTEIRSAQGLNNSKFPSTIRTKTAAYSQYPAGPIVATFQSGTGK